MGKKSGGGSGRAPQQGGQGFGTQYGGAQQGGGLTQNGVQAQLPSPPRGHGGGFANWGGANGTQSWMNRPGITQGQGQPPPPSQWSQAPMAQTPQGPANTRQVSPEQFQQAQQAQQARIASMPQYTQGQGLSRSSPVGYQAGSPSSQAGSIASHQAAPWTQGRMDQAGSLNNGRVMGQMTGTNGVQQQAQQAQAQSQISNAIANQMQNPQKSTNSPQRQANIAAYLQQNYGG